MSERTPDRPRLATAGHFLVEPLEPLTFGGPRSFSAGEGHRQRSQFPPSPRTFQGLVRSQLLRGADPPLDLDAWSQGERARRAALVGDADSLPPGWQLQGPLPARMIPSADGEEPPLAQPWVPIPRLLLRHGQRLLPSRPVESTHPARDDRGSPDPRTLAVGRPDLTEAEPADGWLAPSALWRVLTGDDGIRLGADACLDLPPFVRREHQPGLAIERGGTGTAPERARAGEGTARHGMLYVVEALRFKRGSGLLGRLRASLAPPLRPAALADGGANAGRKGRLARFRGIEDFDPDWSRIRDGEHLPKQVADGQCFWLLSLTPAFLERPERPDLGGSPRGAEVEVLAALHGRPLTLGGFDMAHGRPRPNRGYCPAGSAWLIAIRGGTAQQRRERLVALHDTHPLGPRDEAAFGFGHTLVGLAPSITPPPKEHNP